MGRHAAPELDSPTEVIVRPQVQDPIPAAISIDNRAKLGAFAAIGVVLVGFGALASLGSSHSSSTSTTSAAEEAHSEGSSYGASLRDAGYNSTYVLSSCVNTDYTGSYLQDYKNGCIGIVFQMQDHGR